VTTAYQVMALLGLSQAAAALTLGVFGVMHWVPAVLVFGASWAAYVEASERARA
jgi:hypothetical protein